MRLIIIFLMLAVSVGAAYVTWNMMQKPEPQPQVVIQQAPQPAEPQVQTVEVIVARNDIPIGTALKAEHLDRQPWPSHLVLDDFIVSDGKDADLMGLVTRSNFRGKEPIIRSRLANPSDPSFLAATLPPGKRAVTIPVDAISSVAGFIFPGDRVDVVINHQVDFGMERLPNGAINKKTEQVSEVLMSNIKVLALDQRFSAHTGEGPAVPSTATLEVTPLEALKLRLSEGKGTISLVLRGLKADEEKQMARPLMLQDISTVVPPSYFPVVYDPNATYDPLVVNFFENAPTLEAGDVEKGAAQPGKVSLPSLGATQGMSGASSSMPGASGEQSNITIIRGTQREVVGVDGQ